MRQQTYASWCLEAACVSDDNNHSNTTMFAIKAREEKCVLWVKKKHNKKNKKIWIKRKHTNKSCAGSANCSVHVYELCVQSN